MKQSTRLSLATAARSRLTAARSSPGRFHTIEVRLADRFGARGSDYTVLSRRGFYE